MREERLAARRFIQTSSGGTLDAVGVLVDADPVRCQTTEGNCPRNEEEVHFFASA